MARFTNIFIPVVLVLTLGVSAYFGLDPVEIAGKKFDSQMKTYWAKLRLAPKEYLEKMFIFTNKVCFTPRSNYVRKGSCNQNEVYSLNTETKQLLPVSCGLDTSWPVNSQTWVICTSKNESD